MAPSSLWGTRVDGTDLADVDPVRLAIGALADKVTDLKKVIVVAVRVAGEDGFLILTTYAGAPQSWPVGAESAPRTPWPLLPSSLNAQISGLYSSIHGNVSGLA